MIDIIAGSIVLLLFLAILAFGYNLHMKSIYDDIAHEEAQQIADELFEQAIAHAEIRVNQRLTIVDEMRR